VDPEDYLVQVNGDTEGRSLENEARIRTFGQLHEPCPLDLGTVLALTASGYAL
jgi:hypothetical protein